MLWLWSPVVADLYRKYVHAVHEAEQKVRASICKQVIERELLDRVLADMGSEKFIAALLGIPLPHALISH